MTPERPAPTDRGVRALVPVIESFGLDAPSLEEVRARFHDAASHIPPTGGRHHRTGPRRGSRAARIRPDGAEPDGRILYLHGGAYVIGSAEVQLGVPARLSLATGCEVVSLDYRVAPEHPCPAATDDTVAAYEALLGNGPVTALAGDSAGGGLAPSPRSRSVTGDWHSPRLWWPSPPGWTSPGHRGERPSPASRTPCSPADSSAWPRRPSSPGAPLTIRPRTPSTPTSVTYRRPSCTSAATASCSTTHCE
ncbi:MAG: alpha/beta hydrolase fold domain-containing protein [Acidimicrobiia bacterium]|nr:alpha/beta hydrolase fold domain-containing protein [Acidimicrobiia bacterium]